MRRINLVLMMIALAACRPELPMNPNPPDDSGKLELLWKKNITDAGGSISIDPVLYDDVVVINSERLIHGVNAPVMFLDTATGELLDTWSDYGHGASIYLPSNSAAEDEYLILVSQYAIDCVNLRTRNTQWSTAIRDHGLPWPAVHNGYVYYSFTREYGQTKSTFLMRSPCNTESWDTIIRVNDNRGTVPFFMGLGFGQLSNGDEVVLWKNRIELSNNRNEVQVFAYNLTADSLQWKSEKFSDFCSIQKIQVESDRVYVGLGDLMVCLDINSGRTHWIQDFEELNSLLPFKLYDGNFMVLNNNKIAVKAASKDLVFLFKGSGNIAKVVQDVHGGIGDEFTYFEDKLFYTGMRLTIVDAKQGTELVSESQVSHLRTPESKIVIDPVRRVMYYHDFYYLYCVKIPDNI